MIEIYCSAFNLNRNRFDGWQDGLRNFCDFADRVTVCVNIDPEENDDGTYDSVNKLGFDKLNVVRSSFSLKDPEFDGKIKNKALQETKLPAKVLLDLDERIPKFQRNQWDSLFLTLNSSPFDGILIPSVNLCGDIYSYKDIGYKFYLHKGGLKRGVVNGAKNLDGSIDINRSDTCELLKPDGSLANCFALPRDLDLMSKEEIPYVFHLWAVNPKSRLKQNETWKPVWENRAKRPVSDIVLDETAIKQIKTLNHGLHLW